MSPSEALRRIAFLLERAGEATYRVRAFRRAAAVVEEHPPEAIVRRVAQGTLTELPGIGRVTAEVIGEAANGQVPAYLQRLETADAPALSEAAAQLRQALKGDLHTHSDWSDGGSPIEEMARTARFLGHDYIALTDHSPRLTVARGLSPQRLRDQLGVVAQLNETLAPFRILTGIEVDILEDGTLDQEPGLLDQLDIVVASVHSKLAMPAADMTPRMIRAIQNPRTTVLGHVTGRLIVGRGRPESQFDAEAVFAACRDHDVAVEINSRPERLDPPQRLLEIAIATGCNFTIDTDAHAPGQLDWQRYGCELAVAAGVPPDRIINTLPLPDLLAWARSARRKRLRS